MDGNKFWDAGMNSLSGMDEKQMGENGRRYFLERFERKKITKQWKEALEKVSSKQ